MKDLDRVIFKIVEAIEETNKDDIFTILNHLGVDATKLRVHFSVKRLVKSRHLDYSVGFKSIVLADNPPLLKGFYDDVSIASAMRCTPSINKYGVGLKAKYENAKERIAKGKFSVLDTHWHLKIYKDILEASLKSVKLNILLIDKIRQLPPIQVRIVEIHNQITKHRK